MPSPSSPRRSRGGRRGRDAVRVSHRVRAVVRGRVELERERAARDCPTRQTRWARGRGRGRRAAAPGPSRRGSSRRRRRASASCATGRRRRGGAPSRSPTCRGRRSRRPRPSASRRPNWAGGRRGAAPSTVPPAPPRAPPPRGRRRALRRRASPARRARASRRRAACERPRCGRRAGVAPAAATASLSVATTEPLSRSVRPLTDEKTAATWVHAPSGSGDGDEPAECSEPMGSAQVGELSHRSRLGAVGDVAPRAQLPPPDAWYSFHPAAE